MRDLLLLLCQYPFDEKNRETLSKLIDQVKDWKSLVELINAHGIIALAAYNLKEAGLEMRIPEKAMTILQNGYMRNIGRNAWLTERWKEVNTILCSAGIKHLLLKGMALEHTLYGSRGLRQMNDNDILIKPQESVQAWNLLVEHGFTPEPFKSSLFKKIMFDFGHHLPALYKNGYSVEIHNNLFEVGTIDKLSLKDPFTDAVEISIGAVKANTLSGEMQLAYLIKHFEHHAATGDCQLRLYADIILTNKESKLTFPERFLPDPIQSNRKEFRRTAYKTRILSINPKHRMRFLIGDTFPSLKWMKERYKCSWFKALLIYPLRTGKLWWLLG